MQLEDQAQHCLKLLLCDICIYSKEAEIVWWYLGLRRPSANRDYEVPLGSLGTKHSQTQLSISPMHHQPELRLAQSQAHFQEIPIELVPVGGNDTSSLIKFQEEREDGAR